MSVMKSISEKAAANIKAGNGGDRKTNRAGTVAATDIANDFAMLSKDLTSNQFRRIIHKLNTTVRRETVKKLRKASSANTIGESMRGKMTRGDWKNPRRTKNGVEYLAGGWYGKVLKDRGNTKRSMAHNGGEDGLRGGGKSGIISRTFKAKNSHIMRGYTGPRHSGSTGDDGDNGKYGYNYAHMLEFGGNHVNWDSSKKRTSKLIARPFLAPAGRETLPKQKSIIIRELKKWGQGK